MPGSSMTQVCSARLSNVHCTPAETYNRHRLTSLTDFLKHTKIRKIAAYSGDVCICSYKSWALYCLILKAKQQAMSAMQPRHFKIESLL